MIAIPAMRLAMDVSSTTHVTRTFSLAALLKCTSSRFSFPCRIFVYLLIIRPPRNLAFATVLLLLAAEEAVQARGRGGRLADALAAVHLLRNGALARGCPSPLSLREPRRETEFGDLLNARVEGHVEGSFPPRRRERSRVHSIKLISTPRPGRAAPRARARAPTRPQRRGPPPSTRRRAARQQPGSITTASQEHAERNTNVMKERQQCRNQGGQGAQGSKKFVAQTGKRTVKIRKKSACNIYY